MSNIYRYSLLILSLISVSGAFVYKVYRLDNIGLLLSLALTILSFVIILFLRKKLKERGLFLSDYKSGPITLDYSPKAAKIQAKGIWLLAAYLLSAGISLFILFRGQSERSLISPWETLPSYFFLAYFFSLILLYANIRKNAKLAIYLICFQATLSFSIALIVYKLGFGYDPFIHTATMEYIDRYGQALPKPFYYLGYYSLIIIAHKLTLIPIALMSKAIVPVLSGVLLPLAIYQAGKKWFSDRSNILLAVVFLFILPFSVFIISTPQNLSYLFLAIILFYGIYAKSYLDHAVMFLLGVAALTFQPITGLPALCLSLGIFLHNSRYFRRKKLLFTLLLLFNTLILPLIFYYVTSSSIQGNSAKLGPSGLGSAAAFLKVNMAGKETVILNMAYFIIFNYKFLLFALVLAGLYIIYRYRADCRILALYAAFSPSLLLSWLLTRLLPFNFLIAYEQNNYSDRILVNAGLFLLPMLFVVGHALAVKLASLTPKLRSIYYLAIALLITVSLYQSYPRFDNYFNTHGYSVSKLDIDAVDWIKNDAKGDYIVLANQQVSAAALKEFGFSRYYKPNPAFLQTKNTGLSPDTDIFYYPVPTGGPLYPYYLKMVDEKPSRSTILEAMDLAGVSEGYFVLNKYWWAFSKVLDEAKAEADRVEVFGNKDVLVFKYMK